VSLALSHRRWEPWLAGLLVLQLGVGVVSAVELRPTAPRTRGRGTAINASVVRDARTTAVRALLAARSTAVLHHDRAAFLATIDPTATAFRVRQVAVIAALHDVPFASWSYEVDPERGRSHAPALDALRGTRWSPDVVLHYAIAGFDPTPTAEPQSLTFVQRAGRWYLAADDDFDTTDHPTTRDMWDGGPVVVARSRACLVLSHPRNREFAKVLAGECDVAVPRVTAVWGTGWSRRVVLIVPDSAAELTRMVPDAGDLSQISAVATAALVGPSYEYHPVGDRVIVNPENFTALRSIGRRVVLTHEITHVASRPATGPQVPTWFVEGLAEYVGYQGVPLSVRAAASELRADLRRGRLPKHLPVDTAFNGSRKDLPQTYEMSWLAVVLMAKTYGRSAVLKVYRDTGADLSPGALDRAMHKVLQTSLPAFTAAWRGDLTAQLG
jgi:hypothetical protein